jgi:hypothetical protein
MQGPSERDVCENVHSCIYVQLYRNAACTGIYLAKMFIPASMYNFIAMQRVLESIYGYDKYVWVERHLIDSFANGGREDFDSVSNEKRTSTTRLQSDASSEHHVPQRRLYVSYLHTAKYKDWTYPSIQSW